MHDSNIISFFEMRCPDSEGRMLDEILDKSDDWFEFCHDYIQWLFPLKEPSQFNPDAPLLTQEDIDYFRSPDAANAASNYIESIERMFAFFGLNCANVPGRLKLEEADNFEARKHTWAEDFNHNHLRITRMISSMKLLGFGNYAQAFYDYISVVGGSENSKKYWEDAILNG
jgi:hypothetical protein